MQIDKVCIICPKGCKVTCEFDEFTKKVSDIVGTECKKGDAYIIAELINPIRTIQSSVLVNNGDFPLVSVKTSKAIPKEKIFDVMQVIKSIKVDAPLEIGSIVYKDILSLGVDIVTTKPVKKSILL